MALLQKYEFSMTLGVEPPVFLDFLGLKNKVPSYKLDTLKISIGFFSLKI